MKNSEKNGTGKKKIRNIQKDQVDYFNSEVFTVYEDLEIDDKFVVGYEDLEFIDLKNAYYELGLSEKQLVRELQKKGCRLWLRFDHEHERNVIVVPPNNRSEPIDYQINPGDILQFTIDSIRRIEQRMLAESKFSFLDLRLELQFGDLPLIVEIIQEDEGMHLVILKDDFDKLPVLQQEEKNSLTKRRSRKSHPKINALFWRTYQMLLDQNLDHTYKNVWDKIYDEWQIFEEKKDLQNKVYDIDEIVEKMDASKQDNAHANFYIREGNCSVVFKLSSLSTKLSKLKIPRPKPDLPINPLTTINGLVNLFLG